MVNVGDIVNVKYKDKNTKAFITGSEIFTKDEERITIYELLLQDNFKRINVNEKELEEMIENYKIRNEV